MNQIMFLIVAAHFALGFVAVLTAEIVAPASLPDDIAGLALVLLALGFAVAMRPFAEARK